MANLSGDVVSAFLAMENASGIQPAPRLLTTNSVIPPSGHTSTANGGVSEDEPAGGYVARSEPIRSAAPETSIILPKVVPGQLPPPGEAQRAPPVHFHALDGVNRISSRLGIAHHGRRQKSWPAAAPKQVKLRFDDGLTPNPSSMLAISSVLTTDLRFATLACANNLSLLNRNGMPADKTDINGPSDEPDWIKRVIFCSKIVWYVCYSASFIHL